MREIGGYLELEKMKGTEYYPQALALNTARNALEYLLRARSIRKLLLPLFLCDSVRTICQRNAVEIEFYHIDNEFKPVLHRSLGEKESLYLVNYYGCFSDEDLRKWRQQYPHLIVDQAHAFFQQPVEDTDTIYCCRKFFGVPDGAYLFTDVQLEGRLEEDQSHARMAHLLGRVEEAASCHYMEFRSVEDSFASLPLKQMSKLTHQLLKGIDYNEIREKRKENWDCLHRAFGERNLICLDRAEGLYCYPLYVEHGAELRQRLLKEKIYLPVLWADVLENPRATKTERALAENILPLPIDQRYTQEDMEAMIRQISDKL